MGVEILYASGSNLPLKIQAGKWGLWWSGADDAMWLTSLAPGDAPSRVVSNVQMVRAHVPGVLSTTRTPGL